ncbi:NUDIX domain-containing protein [Candidatus Nomurabacteria bacterium]|nr:NUDIX domain-containing protein [Candidatus Nomurabacteria bacterium]
MSELRPKVGIGIIVIKPNNDRREIMLHQRIGSFGQGYWGSGGGHLENGESLENAVMRELAEEAGKELKIKNLRLHGIYNFTDLMPKHYVDITFVADWESGEPQNTAPEETSEWVWCALDDLPSPLFPPLKKYLDGIDDQTILYH